MFMKIIAAAAVLAIPAAAHAQQTTPTVPQDTTHSSVRTDSTKVDTANGSIYTKKKTTKSDTTKATRTHTDSTMTPIDSTRMGVPTTKSKTPPR